MFRADVGAPMRCAILILVPLLACSPPPPPNEDGCAGDWFADYLREGEAPEADVSCADGALAHDAIDETCVADATIDGTLVDHESSDPVADVEIEVFLANAATGDPDQTLTSDAEGKIAVDAKVCAPFAYRTDRGNDEARVTTKQHLILAPGDPLVHDFRSVRESSVGLIKTLLQQELTEGTGIVFGKAAGCDGDSAVDRVQVIVRDADCKVPPDYAAGYTSNRVPDVFLAATSTEGFFFAMNVPPGDWILEGYVQDGDSFRVVAQTPVTVSAEEVTLADLALGRDDGLVVPPGCRGGC
jgi:hypothetical protein